jgi:hypothetical protein
MDEKRVGLLVRKRRGLRQLGQLGCGAVHGP